VFGRGSGRSGCVDRSARELLGGHAVEKGILLAFELGDRTDEHVTLPAERIGVAAAFAGFGVGERRFRDQRAEPGTVGFLFHEHELLLGHCEISAQATETVADVDEPPLQQGVGHVCILRAAARHHPGKTRQGNPANHVKNPHRRVRKA
jgi:hypothetical protein